MSYLYVFKKDGGLNFKKCKSKKENAYLNGNFLEARAPKFYISQYLKEIPKICLKEAALP